MLAAEELKGSAAWRVVVFLALAAMAGTVALVRYELFRSGASLPYYLQALHALAAHGPGAVSSWTGQPILGLHGPLVLMPLAYLTAVGGPGLLLLTQAVAVGIGFLYLDDWLVAGGTPWAQRRLVGWAYLLSTLLWGVEIQDFHPVVLAIPALVAAATLFDRRRMAAGLVAITAAALCSLAVIPVAALLALVLAARRRLAEALAAAAWAVAAGLVAQAATRASWAALLGIPSHALNQSALTGHTWLYLGYLLVPVLVFGPGRGLVWMLPALWVMLIGVWTGGAAATSPFSAGSALAAPFMLMALAAVVAEGRFYRWWRLSLAAYVILFVVFLGHEASLRHEGPPLGQLTTVTQALAVVPPNATVVAPSYVAAHLAVRNSLLSLTAAGSWPADSYVVVDTTYTEGMPAGALPPVLARLKHDAKTRYSYDGVWVFYLAHPERGL
jgi:hypothetical protein